MFSFGISTLFVSLIARSCVQASTTFESPFGLTFISTMAIASRFNGSGFIELSKHPLDARYQAIYQEALDVVDPLSFNLQDLTHVSVFQNAVKPVIESLRKRLGHEPEYAALLVPSTFRASLRDAAVEGVLVHEDAQRAFRQGWAREATCPGYGFLDGKNLGRRSEDCTEDGPVNLVVVLEYEKEYLHTWLMKVEFELETYPPIHSKFSRDCGERYIERTGDQGYKDRLDVFLGGFIEEALQRHWDDNPRNNIRVIVLSGEASPARNKELGELARHAIGTTAATVRTELDWSEIVAHGAAVWVRNMQRSPRAFVIETGNRVDELVEHDEF